MLATPSFLFFFFFNDTATTEIYTLSLHDALPISPSQPFGKSWRADRHDHKFLEIHRVIGVRPAVQNVHHRAGQQITRSEEHTSELQSRLHLVCRLLLEKKKKNFTASN